MAKFYHICDVVLASFRPYEGLWTDGERRKWISLADRTLKSMVEVALDMIRDQNTPKNILIMFFQKSIGGVPIRVVRGYMDEILAEARSQRWNKVSFSTCWFVPTHQKIWDQVGEFNALAHNANELMGRARVNIHRSLMSRVSEDSYKLRNRLAMWAEPQMGLSLGYHLSYEGVKNVVGQVLNVLDTGFKMKRKRSSSEPEAHTPPSLDKTPGWKNNSFMMRILEDKGLLRVVRQPGQRRPRRQLMSYQKMPGSENWQVFLKHGELPRYQQREGVLEAMILMWNKADAIPVWDFEEEVVVEKEVVKDVVVESEAVEVAVEALEVNGDDDAPYDPEDWIATDDIVVEFDNKVNVRDDNEVECAEGAVAQEVVVAHDDSVVQDDVFETPENKTKYNEDDKDDKDVEWLLNRLQEKERRAKVDKEKIRAYRLDIEKGKVALAREKASVKFYKQQVEGKDAKIEQLERELASMEDTRRFERNAYKARMEARNVPR